MEKLHGAALGRPEVAWVNFLPDNDFGLIRRFETKSWSGA
jgi:hypothetical protein